MTRDSGPRTGMQNAPPRLPVRGPASTHDSSKARRARLASCGENEAKARSTSSVARPQSTVASPGTGATMFHQASPGPVPPGPSPWRACNSALALRNRRKSGNEAVTAACIAPSASSSTALDHSAGARASGHPRRLFTVTASPLMPLRAAAMGTAAVSQAATSAR
jgi:hypothetical protein